ncbi:hypothetical protein TIFTF001_030410 [Ficus carica]|uniref:Uncharacterized protein n=1 Tax=Ficus carica TaxID=3494 RepID=A0AA88DT42_FICCA|nr:hypothetical protein TIFTF001_030410 [Ficus carica]
MLVRHGLGAVLQRTIKPTGSLVDVHEYYDRDGFPLDQRTIIWHYFEAHPRVQRTFHQLPDDDRRGIIASVVKSQSPAAD